jgi:DNA-binding response OmpR family regulator
LANQAIVQLTDGAIDPRDADTVTLINQVRSALQSIDGDAAREHERSPVLPKPRTLVVDDNINEAKLLAGFLKLRNFDVSIATDGQEALDYLEENEAPEVVLLDMSMPRLDGPSTIRKLRSSVSHQSLRVYGVSGGEPQDYGVSLDENGVNGWFRKPLNPETLVDSLKLFEQQAANEATESRTVVNEGTFGYLAAGLSETDGG